MKKSEKERFEQPFKIKNTVDTNVHLHSEWANHITLARKNMPNKILISPEIMELAFPECIFQTYLQSLISYDTSMKWLYSNKDLRDIYEEYVGTPSHFSNHITAFKSSYKIYYHALKPGTSYHMAFTNFQQRFYNFLLNSRTIHNKPERMQYAVPGHLVPIIISIIMAWKYSPVAYPNNIGADNISFYHFQKAVFQKLGSFGFLAKDYKLFTLYFLHYFFNDEYFAYLQIPVFQRNRKVMVLLENEHKNYTNALYKITTVAPYLFLKSAAIDLANRILENNTQLILAPETEYTACPEIEAFLNAFFENLISLTEKELSKVNDIMKKELLRLKHTQDQQIIHIATKSLQTYIKFLIFNNDTYVDAMYKLCQQLLKQIETYQKTLEFNTYKASNLIQTEKTLNEFLSKTKELLINAVEKHKKLLESGIISVERSESKSTKSYKPPKQVFTTDLIYENTFRIILENISKLEKHFEKIPPIELKNPKYLEMYYENITNELLDVTEFYNKLYLSFEEELKTKLDYPDVFFHTFHSYLKEYGKQILSELLSNKEIENVLK